MLTYDLYWSFRSPYSYFIASRLRALEEAFEVRCNVRPVFPIAVRTPEFFEGRDPLWFSYFMADIRREAEFLGLPMRWPRPDPVYRAPDGSYPAEQPLIHRLTYLGVAAAERGRGLPFLDEVSRVIWSGEITDWHEGDHVRRATERAGLDHDELVAAADSDSERYRAIIEESQAAQRAGGHYGVPMMVFDGEPFFGQDRFDQLKWRMEQKGLKRRTPA
ncbi:DsbA family protein [Phenylobacterium sp.]|uniref:2-hydroxychromene-2-carboxylate isomerase n=1 Tax=Phenylobacterium sp. TaxID=1871053 RepID=UPI00301D086A